MTSIFERKGLNSSCASPLGEPSISPIPTDPAETPPHGGEEGTPLYDLRLLYVVGQGSFGVVTAASVAGCKELVAVKSIRCEKRDRTSYRELSILKDTLQGGKLLFNVVPCDRGLRVGCTSSEFTHFPTLSHPNIVQLYGYHISDELAQDGLNRERYLHLMLSYMPSDLQRVRNKFFSSSFENVDEKRSFPPLLAKLVVFQVARALAFLHSHHIVHRDVKPSNILLDEATGYVQLSDYGSAKEIHRNRSSVERNTSYICSRFYRAPELLFGSMVYGPEIDVWSLGCVLGEAMKVYRCRSRRGGGGALFQGCTTVDQMAALFKGLGTPTQEEMRSMNPHCSVAMQLVAQKYRTVFPCEGAPSTATEPVDVQTVFPIQRRTWEQLLHTTSFPPLATDLLQRLLCYDPRQRLTALEVVEHPFFDELFSSVGERATVPLLLPSGKCVSAEIFLMTEDEKKLYSPNFITKMNSEFEKTIRWKQRGTSEQE